MLANDGAAWLPVAEGYAPRTGLHSCSRIHRRSGWSISERATAVNRLVVGQERLYCWQTDLAIVNSEHARRHPDSMRLLFVERLEIYNPAAQRVHVVNLREHNGLEEVRVPMNAPRLLKILLTRS
jgi:hypothetical protein